MKTGEAREATAWLHEVRGMMGRGWEGWRIGVAKDIVGQSARCDAGLVYEFIGRPFEVFRALTHSSLPSERAMQSKGILQIAINRVQTRGILSMFQSADISRSSSRGQRYLRLLGRVGPWGLAFWIWEVLGLGMD